MSYSLWSAPEKTKRGVEEEDRRSKNTTVLIWTVLRIRNVNPGSPDPDFYPFLSIPDPTTATKEKGKMFSFFVFRFFLSSHKYHTIENYLFALEEQIFSQFIKNNKIF
jgi:hypothetical protein